MGSVVLDTNVLVDGAQDELSASWRIVQQILDGKLTVYLSEQLRQEYERILGERVADVSYHDRIGQFLSAARTVELKSIPHVIEEDPDDNTVLGTALAGAVDALVTSDRHLLGLDPYDGLRILTPKEFLNRRMEDETGWTDFARSIGLPETP